MPTRPSDGPNASSTPRMVRSRALLAYEGGGRALIRRHHGPTREGWHCRPVEGVGPQHEVDRERLREGSGGTADYETVIIFVDNTGPEALGGAHPPAMFFEAVDIYDSMFAAITIGEYPGNWYQYFKDRVQNDRPLKLGPA
ncbi:hypothetical protein B0H13DRAFT_1901089 [Mycena leptocephala]|nr:hypothetical protein B0H13DRAFT_1901089 [Mycena leptocephala]